MSKIFSHRYRRALANGVIAIELSNEFRRKLWSQIPSHNHTIRVRRDPNDSWIDNSSVFHEATSNLKIEHGWEHLPGNLICHEFDVNEDACRNIIIGGDAPIVFDLIELAFKEMEEEIKFIFRWRIQHP